VGFKTSVEMNCLIFDKVLTTSPASMEDNAESGEILNFVQVDSQKLTMMMMQSPNTITIPIMLVAYSIMLFTYLGWSFSFGLAVLLLFVLINFFLQRKFKKYQKIRQREIDKRLKVTTETLFNLKVLKLYSWEDFFLGKIDEKRENELKATSNTFNITNLNRTLLWFSPIATAVVSIGAYQYYTDKPDVANIFTCLGILSSIQEPIRQLAMVYTNILDSLISLKRVEKFLSQADIKEENIILNDENTIKKGIDILISNGNFSWGAGKKSALKGDDKKKKMKKKKLY
jgi:ATP-binding cassette subfamily C (CFTR/MRP) protein 1